MSLLNSLPKTASREVYFPTEPFLLVIPKPILQQRGTKRSLAQATHRN
jgi:hypothetical protein